MSAPDKKRKRDDDQSDQIPQKAQKTESASEPSAKVGEVKKRGGTARQKKSERKTKKQLKREAAKERRKSFKKPASNVDGLATGHDFVSLGDNWNGAEAREFSRVKYLKREGRSSKGSSPRSIRKQKRAEKEALEAAQAAAGAKDDESGPKETQPEQPEPRSPAPAGAKDGEHERSSAPSKSRFIVFVGNLPYDATTEQIQTHFAKLQPASVRHQTDKKTGKSKGFAFLEFDQYDRMKTCLQLYHHSIFDPHGSSSTFDNDDPEQEHPNDSKKSRGRKLNVELTAGGGGKSNDRKAKIIEKNKKLTEQRERAKVKANKKKADAERKRILKAEKEGKTGKRTGANAETVAANDQTDTAMGDIHPSRLARVKG